MTDDARAAEQERETLAGIAEAVTVRAASVPSAPPPPTTMAGLPVPPDLGRRRAEWKASGMSNEEIEDMTAEMLGQPVPAREAKPREAEAPSLVHIRDWLTPPAPVEPLDMTDDELAEAITIVRMAKARVIAAADALQKATAEQTAALDAYDAAKRLVAAGVAALTT